MVTTNNTCPKAGTTATSPDVLALIDGARAAAQSDDGATLYELADVVRLASFACEARRILRGVDLAVRLKPSIGADLSDLIDARNQWLEVEETTGRVLDAVAERLRRTAECASSREASLGVVVRNLAGRV